MVFVLCGSSLAFLALFTFSLILFANNSRPYCSYCSLSLLVLFYETALYEVDQAVARYSQRGCDCRVSCERWH